MFNNFQGTAKPLDKVDVPVMAHRLDVSQDHLQAFLNVESRSRGFNRNGQPIILNEPHVFYRNLQGQARTDAVNAGMAYRKWGTKPYLRTQAERYEWLNEAMKYDVAAALKACSWGSTQILGENASLVGYGNVQEMVRSFMEDEEHHIEAMVNYILATGIDDDLRAGRWSTVARVYNGPGYKKNKYHIKLANEYARLSRQADVDWSPDREDPERLSIPDKETTQKVQRQLRDLGYNEVGLVDGHWGSKTRGASLAFRYDNGLPLVADIDHQLLSALMTSSPRPISEARANTTVEDVRKSGSGIIGGADKTQQGAVVAMLTSGAAAVAPDEETGSSPIDLIGDFTSLKETVGPFLQMLETMQPWLIVGLGGYIVYQQFFVKDSRVKDVQNNVHSGRY